MVVAQQPRRWTRDEYDRMVEAGILGPEDRVELIEGEILTMLPRDSQHATATQLCGDSLRDAFGPGFEIRPQFPLALSDDSEPEPDIAVVPGSARDYRDAHPSSALLIVEVADATLGFDRRVKRPLYAACGISDYWILNLRDRTLEVHRHPQGREYGTREVLPADGEISPLERPQASLRVADLLP